MTIGDIGKFFTEAMVGFLTSPIACSPQKQPLQQLKIAPLPQVEAEQEPLQSFPQDAAAPISSSTVDSYEESQPEKIPGSTPQYCRNACDYYSRQRTQREKNKYILDVLEKTVECLNDCSAQSNPSQAAVCVFKKTKAEETDLSSCFPEGSSK